MSKYGANLPAIWNPVGDTCVQVYIPNHPDYIKLFLRAVRMLEVQRMYARDETMTGAKIVAEQWRDRTITPLIEALANSTGSCGVDGECLAYPPFASFISYSPQNPYTDPDLIPEGFEQPPFFVNGKDPAHDLPNYNKGDVILDFGSINIEPSWDLEKTPRIELCLEGSGVVEIHFLNIVQGGAAIVSLDNPVDLGDIIAGIIGDGIDSIDLNQDIVSLPPETAEEIIIEIEIPTEGEHVVYIYFLPTVNDSLIPLAFGGGLREVSLCGNLRPCGTPPPPPPPPLEGVTELKPQFQFTPDCGLEYRLLNQDDEIVQDWTPVEGWTENAALCFAVGGGGVATKEDIRDALKEWTQWGASAILGYEVDEDGNIIIPPDAGEELPPDDPLTAVDETLSAQAGGAIAVRTGVNKFLADLALLFGSDTTEDMTVATAQSIMAAKYKVDVALLNPAMVTYWGFRAAGTTVIGSLNAATLDNDLFCKGVSHQTINNVVLAALVVTNPVKINCTDLMNAITDEQLSDWFNYGANVPSTAYVGYTCTKIASETFTLNMALAESFTIPFAGTFKAGHRYLIEAEGSFTDADFSTKIQDFFWKKDNSTGVLTFIGFTLSVSGTTNATAAQVPYQPSHKYAWTFDKTGTDGGSFTKGNDEFTITGSPVVGTITVKMTDLGEYTL